MPAKSKNAGGEYRQRGVAGSDLQQRFTVAEKIIPDLKFTAAFGRGRYVCPRNLTALASTEPTQQDLLAFLDDELTPNNQEEQKRCAKLKGDLDTYKWDGLRDHTDIAIDDDLWRRLSTDKASCLNRNCYYYRECPFLSLVGKFRKRKWWWQTMRW